MSVVQIGILLSLFLIGGLYGIVIVDRIKFQRHSKQALRYYVENAMANKSLLSVHSEMEQHVKSTERENNND